MNHDSTLRDAEPGQGNRDQSCRDAQKRLERFAVEFFADPFFGPGHVRNRTLVVEFSADDRRALEIGPIDDAGLEEAPEAVLKADHRELQRLESPVEPATARRLARDRYQAVNALIYLLRGDKHAKQKLLDLTEDAPLTICMGDRYRIGGNRILRPVKTQLGEVTFTVDGCRSIFPDVVRTSGGKMWPGLCPACRGPRKKPTRDQARALRRRLNEIWEGEGPRLRVERYSVTLPLDDPPKDETRLH